MSGHLLEALRNLYSQDMLERLGQETGKDALQADLSDYWDQMTIAEQKSARKFSEQLSSIRPEPRKYAGEGNEKNSG
jgi:hypothetical protein